MEKNELFNDEAFQELLASDPFFLLKIQCDYRGLLLAIDHHGVVLAKGDSQETLEADIKRKTLQSGQYFIFAAPEGEIPEIDN